MTGASAQWSTFLQPRPWPIGQTSAKTSSLREPTAQDLALKKIQIHPILGSEILKKKQPESRILLCTARSCLNNT